MHSEKKATHYYRDTRYSNNSSVMQACCARIIIHSGRIYSPSGPTVGQQNIWLNSPDSRLSCQRVPEHPVTGLQDMNQTNKLRTFQELEQQAQGQRQEP